MLQLSEIYIYPIKSLGGIRLSEAEITTRGIKYDRRWMLVDANGRFMSQREFPKMTLLKTSIFTNFLKIDDSTTEKELLIRHEPALINVEKKVMVSVWDDHDIVAYEVGNLANNWFSEALGTPTRLVYMPEESHRKVEEKYFVEGDEITSFSDGYPILIIGTASLADLNNRLESPVTINRFRPNFVFTGGGAYEEEDWHKFTIGGVIFYGVKPCGRCVMTTINQETGQKTGKEPLLTLSKYRKVGNKILFGQNVLASQLGTVREGDFMKVLSRIS